MANQGQNLRFKAGELTGQAQMKADGLVNQPSNVHNYDQDTNFLQQTGDQVKNMAQGAATIAQGAVQGAANIAQGAAVGAANIAQGAAGAVKNTLGINPQADSTTSHSTTTTNHPTYPSTHPNTRI